MFALEQPVKKIALHIGIVCFDSIDVGCETVNGMTQIKTKKTNANHVTNGVPIKVETVLTFTFNADS